MEPTIVPELSVTDLARSLQFYTAILPFRLSYGRPEDGFACLLIGDGALLLDQAGLGRSFEDARCPMRRPFGRGLNLQIAVPAIAPLLDNLAVAGWPLFLPQEDRWYRRDDRELGNRQFVVADPDGYLLRFFQDLGSRPAR